MNPNSNNNQARNYDSPSAFASIEDNFSSQNPNNAPGRNNANPRSIELQYTPYQPQSNYNPNQNLPLLQNQMTMQGMGQSNYVPPSFNNNNNSNNYYNHQTLPNTTTNNGMSSRLIEIDTRISKYSDFVGINYGMFIWSILCFLISIWSITSTDYLEQIIYNKEDEEVLVKTNNFNWYNVLCFFANLIHCVGYFYAIRAYNKQSKVEMSHSHYVYITLASINTLFFVVYIFFIHCGFFTFCIDLVFLIFNVLLYFQSIELTKLYEEKDAMKLMYL